MKEIQKNEMVLFFDLEDTYKLETPETEVVIKFRVLNRSQKDMMVMFKIRFSASMGIKVVEEFKETSVKKILQGDDFEAETRLILESKGKHWLLLTGSFGTTNKDRNFQAKIPFQVK